MSPIDLNKRKKQRTQKRKIFFRKWHRRIGFVACLFLVNLAVTGIMLNHYQALSLHKKYIHNAWLLDWYGVKQPLSISCLKYKHSQLCQVDHSLFLVDNQSVATLIDNQTSSLVSLSEYNSEIYLTTADKIDIYTPTFQLIESLELADQMILAEDSTQRLVTTQPFQAQQPQLIQAVGKAYRERQISYLKFTQDLHSGQIFALEGKVLTDVTGILLILLALSGLISWYRSKKLNLK